MNAIERKVALLRKGISMSDIARQLDVTPQHVSMVVNGERRSPRVEDAIAAALDIPLHELFEAAA